MLEVKGLVAGIKVLEVKGLVAGIKVLEVKGLVAGIAASPTLFFASSLAPFLGFSFRLFLLNFGLLGLFCLAFRCRIITRGRADIIAHGVAFLGVARTVARPFSAVARSFTFSTLRLGLTLSSSGTWSATPTKQQQHMVSAWSAHGQHPVSNTNQTAAAQGLAAWVARAATQ